VLLQLPRDHLTALRAVAVRQRLEAVILFDGIDHQKHRDAVTRHQEFAEIREAFVVVGELLELHDLAGAPERGSCLLGRDADEQFLSHIQNFSLLKTSYTGDSTDHMMKASTIPRPSVMVGSRSFSALSTDSRTSRV
jgi:hypothetical protein